MYDLQRSPGQIQWVMWHSRTTWWSLYRHIQDKRESGGSSGHQPSFPEWRDNLPLLVQETPGWQHHLWLLRLRPSLWHWTIIGTLSLCDMMLYSTLIQYHTCKQLREKIPRTISYAILWTFSAYWAIKARVRFCWIPSHCSIEGNEKVNQLAKESLDRDIDTMARDLHADLKPLIIYHIQQLVQNRWDVSVHGRTFHLLKATLGPPRKFRYLPRAEEVVITRFRIGHTKATESHISGEQPSQNQTRTTLTQTVTDRSRWPVSCSRF